MGTTLEWLLELLYNELGEINEEDYKRFTEELALLRRLADAYAERTLILFEHGEWECWCCDREGYESVSSDYVGPPVNTKHSSTCDVAIHLDLPREKGDGE